MTLLVSLDGPGSSGKSTVGAGAASRLGYRFLDTGVLYRALTWLALERDVPTGAGEALCDLVPEIEIRPDAQGHLRRVLVAGSDVSDRIHTPRVDRAVSEVARQPEVRAALLPVQRRLAEGGGIIVAGRDIGTVVLPGADLKLYLEVSAEERADRRALERGLDPGGPDARRLADELRRRDELDSTRPVAPLAVPHDATVIRSDGNALEETISLVVRAVEDAAGRENAARGERPTAFQRAVATAARFALSSLARVRVEGREHVPRHGPLLVVANHVSNADPPLVGAFLLPVLDRPLHWLAKEQLFAGPVGAFLRSHNVYPVRAGGSDVDAYRQARGVLRCGGVLIAFPEGTRSPDGRLGEARHGVTLLAARTGVPVLPVGVVGAHRLLPRGSVLPRVGTRVTIRIGQPFRVELEAAPRRRDALHTATDRLMARITALLPPEQRGRYGP